MRKAIQILHVEHSPANALLVNRELRKAGLRFHTRRVDSEESFDRELDRSPPALILFGCGEQGFDGFDALSIARVKCPDVPFIFATSSCSPGTSDGILGARSAKKASQDSFANLVPAVRRALCKASKETQLKHEEQSLHAGEKYFQMVIEHVADYAIYLLDPKGRIATWNAGAERITGHSAQDILGKPLAALSPPEDVSLGIPESVIAKARKNGHFPDEGRRMRKDGSLFWSQGTVTAFRDRDGKLRGFTMVAREVSRKRRPDKSSLPVNARPESPLVEDMLLSPASSKEQEELDYSISHDLRAPLRHILGYVDILQSTADQKLDKATHENLETISRSAAQMGRMIDAMLEFSRIGRARLVPTQVDTAKVVSNVVQELRHETHGRQIDWQIGNLPEVSGDTFMLRRVIFNLLSNAIKFTRNNSGPKIEIGAEDGGDETVFNVRDNGVGFDMNHANRLFGMFQRFDRANSFGGIGAGLAIARRIIHRHGGRTWAKGKLGAGATFYFSIPHSSPGKAV